MSRSEHTIVWRCPSCDNRITTHVPLVEPPRCTRHTGGGKVMQRTNSKK